MIPHSNTREILLVTTTTFSKRQLSETNTKEKTCQPTPVEQLEAACWNGLVNELLPEIMSKSVAGEKLFLWQIETGRSYLKLNLGASLPVFEKRYTLDPNIFLSSQQINQ